MVSTSFIVSISSKAYAASTDPTPRGNGKFLGIISLPPSVQKVFDTISDFIDWCKELPQKIAEMSVHLMSWLYEMVASLILKTPLWLFDNQWFENTTYLFSMVALAIVSVLTVVEAVKRMLYSRLKKHMRAPMEFTDIAKRWAIVAGLTTSVPWLFQKAFQTLNLLSDVIIRMGGDLMKGAAGLTDVSWLDILTLCAFDLVLIGTVIPILIKNAKRFFDIMLLGVIAPLALTAWIFDPYRHYFKQWWTNLKHLAMVQVYYAVFLLVLGLFMFGVPTPETFSGLLIKMLVVIGGFGRMINPPKMLSKYVYEGKEYNSPGKVAKSVDKSYKDSAETLVKPVNIVLKGLGKKSIQVPKGGK